jgi:lipopolysaccharide export system protein LptA
MRLLIAFILIILFATGSSYAQEKPSQIKIIHADEGTSHPTYANTHILKGNVIFEHDSTTMYCDSAYFFLDSNVFHAFSNINVVKGDSMKLKGDTLYYRGISKTADLLGNIVYNDSKFQMVTNSLFYDFNTEIGRYTTPAVITNRQDKNTLRSNQGEYHKKTKTVYFKDSVLLHNENYDMVSDTLVYNTGTKTAYFYGPTEITSKDDKILCNSGIYNTDSEVTSLWNRAVIIGKEQIIEGDSIHYDRESGIGEIYGNVAMKDTANDVYLYGDNGYHNELSDSTAIFGSGQMTQVSKEDTLFLTAEYLTIKTDSLNENKLIRAYREVRIFKSDFQGVCDSLTYKDQDSIMKFFYSPVLWSDDSQIKGNYVEAKLAKENIESLVVNKNAFIISEIDTTMYDQIQGKDIFAKFHEGKITRVDVKGNGKTLYHIQNEDSLYLEANAAECADIVIHFNKGEINTIKFMESPNAIYQAIAEMSRKQRFMEGFEWKISLRPTKDEFVLPDDVNP